MVWQDGTVWGPQYWACSQFEYWLAESRDGRTWSAPRQLVFTDVPYPDAHTFHLTQSFVHRGRLYLHALRHHAGIDLYSSADLQQWTAHPRIGLNAGRSALFGDARHLYLTCPAWVEIEQVQGDRVDVLRSADGGESWQWLKSPAWPPQGITDAAGLVVGSRLYLAWRGHDWGLGQPPLQVQLIRSDDNGQSWSDPRTVAPLTLTGRASFTLRLAAAGDTLAIVQEVRDDSDHGPSEPGWFSARTAVAPGRKKPSTPPTPSSTPPSPSPPTAPWSSPPAPARSTARSRGSCGAG